MQTEFAPRRDLIEFQKPLSVAKKAGFIIKCNLKKMPLVKGF
jgi:hypothetical protein